MLKIYATKELREKQKTQSISFFCQLELTSSNKAFISVLALPTEAGAKALAAAKVATKRAGAFILQNNSLENMKGYVGFVMTAGKEAGYHVCSEGIRTCTFILSFPLENYWKSYLKLRQRQKSRFRIPSWGRILQVDGVTNEDATLPADARRICMLS